MHKYLKLTNPLKGTWKPQYNKNNSTPFPHLTGIDYDAKNKRYYSLYSDKSYGDQELREIMRSGHPFAAQLSEYLWSTYRWSNDITPYMGLWKIDNTSDIRVKI